MRGEGFWGVAVVLVLVNNNKGQIGRHRRSVAEGAARRHERSTGDG
jgi:hypothetical protein